MFFGNIMFFGKIWLRSEGRRNADPVIKTEPVRPTSVLDVRRSGIAGSRSGDGSTQHGAQRLVVAVLELLTAATAQRTEELAELLDDAPELIDERDQRFMTPLMLASHAGCVENVTLLLERGAPRKAMTCIS